MSEDKKPDSKAIFSVGNSGQPIVLNQLNLEGFACSSALPGEDMQYMTSGAYTSDDLFFYHVVDGIAAQIRGASKAQGTYIDIDRYNTVLVVIHADLKADLWLDTAAVAVEALAKKALLPGTAVFDGDIADIISMHFPAVDIGKQDRVVCIFREEWRFGVAFDFNRQNDLDIKRFERSLGILLRKIKYKYYYSAIADASVLEALGRAGWFPFIELSKEEFRSLVECVSNNWDIEVGAKKIIASFDEVRLKNLLLRWESKPYIASKLEIVKSALRCFAANEPVAVIKNIITEIEGILSDAYKAKHGSAVKIHKLLDFAISNAEARSGGADTRLFTEAFSQYLKSYTFANFDPAGPPGSAGSRHAVGHGRAEAQSYTMARALQALLTFDQIAFYLD